MNFLSLNHTSHTNIHFCQIWLSTHGKYQKIMVTFGVNSWKRKTRKVKDVFTRKKMYYVIRYTRRMYKHFKVKVMEVFQNKTQVKKKQITLKRHILLNIKTSNSRRVAWMEFYSDVTEQKLSFYRVQSSSCFLLEFSKNILIFSQGRIRHCF